MRLPVRMNIENRIFYPFLLIFLLFTALFGSVLYYNSYRSLLGQQTAVADLTLETITGEIREYGESSGREGILNACRRRGDVSLVIRDEAGVLLLGPESGANPRGSFPPAGITRSAGSSPMSSTAAISTTR